MTVIILEVVVTWNTLLICLILLWVMVMDEAISCFYTNIVVIKLDVLVRLFISLQQHSIVNSRSACHPLQIHKICISDLDLLGGLGTVPSFSVSVSSASLKSTLKSLNKNLVLLTEC